MKLEEKEYLQINQALFSLVNAYHHRANIELKNSTNSLSVAERGVILVLGQKAPINQRNLAEVMQVSPGPISLYVQKLVKKGLVTKEQDQEDRRNWWLRLTKTGEMEYAETVRGAVEYTKDFLNSLSIEEQRLFHNLVLRASREIGYNW